MNAFAVHEGKDRGFSLSDKSYCLSCRGGILGQGLHVVLIAGERDEHIFGRLSQHLHCEAATSTLLSARSDEHHIPCVLIEEDHMSEFQRTGFDFWNDTEIGATLRTPGGGDSVNDNLTVSVGNGQTGNVSFSNVANALDTMHDQQAAMNLGTYHIRRLTPLECERLQGFPDDWTLIGEPQEEDVKDYDVKYDENGDVIEKTQIGTHVEAVNYYIDTAGKRRKVSDSARYKALGNAIGCGPASFWQLLVKRISALYSRPATLGSLFDGIGGFPLCWARVNGPEQCRWSSEIEEFPCAVVRQHFGDEDSGLRGDYYDAIQKQFRRVCHDGGKRD